MFRSSGEHCVREPCLCDEAGLLFGGGGVPAQPEDDSPESWFCPQPDRNQLTSGYLMDLDIASSNLLLRAIVVEDHLTSLIVPDPYAKVSWALSPAQIMKR